jgi:hypothetical protein
VRASAEAAEQAARLEAEAAAEEAERLVAAAEEEAARIAAEAKEAARLATEAEIAAEEAEDSGDELPVVHRRDDPLDGFMFSPTDRQKARVSEEAHGTFRLAPWCVLYALSLFLSLSLPAV